MVKLWRSVCGPASLLVLLAAGLCWVSRAAAQSASTPSFQVGGLVFGDAYKVLSYHSDEGEGAAGLVLRRGYLTFDADFSDKWFARLRFELNQAGEFETYTFDVDVKDLYVGRKVGRHLVVFGLSPTPTFDLIESIWGLRYLVRTPMDLQGVASRDTGISAKGPLNSAGTLSYRAMVGAGLKFGNETGDGRKFMGALTWQPSSPWTFDLYADYEKLSGPTDRFTFQLFTGYRTDAFRWGIQYSNQDREGDAPLELASAFAVRRLTRRASIVGRVDRIMEPSPKGNNISYLPFDPRSRSTFFIGGVEFRVTPHLSVTPNAVFTKYDESDQGITPRSDLYLRVTAFLNFE
jgi:hypothetical protein